LGETEGGITYKIPLFYDKLSDLRYFFILLPIEYIFHDERINPRGISPRIRGLLDDFLSKHPQLHISLGWIKLDDHGVRVQIFDGKHKAVAQMLLGIRKLPVRVFLNPDLERLLETNTRAGTTLRQVAFDKSVQRYLDWEKKDIFSMTSVHP
jgi:hypothetical protein